MFLIRLRFGGDWICPLLLECHVHQAALEKLRLCAFFQKRDVDCGFVSKHSSAPICPIKFKRQPKSTQDTATSNKLIWLPKDTRMCDAPFWKKTSSPFHVFFEDTHEEKRDKHGWCCHHSTWMALKVKALHQYSITSLEIRWYIQFDAQETFVLATCQAGEDSRIFLGGSGGLAMCPFVVEISPKTRRKSIHLIEIWPDKKNLQPPFLRPELFSRDQTLLPRLNRVGQPTKNGSKEALRKTMCLYGPYPNPRHPKTSSGVGVWSAYLRGPNTEPQQDV